MKNQLYVIALLGLGSLTVGAAENECQRGDRPPPPPPPEEMAAQLVADFDADLDGALKAEELATAMAFLYDNRPPRPGDEEMEEPPEPDHGQVALDMISTADLDGDGELNEAELEEALVIFMRPHPPRHHRS